MASIALNYDSIYDAAKHAKKVASTAEDYVLKLQTKIINNIDSLSGVNTNYTTEAKMQVSKKMMHLYDKRDIYEEYGLKLEQFIENEEYGAKAVDQRVAELFQSEGGFPKKKKKNKSVGSRVFTFLSNAVQTAGEFAYDVLLDITYAVNWVVGELPGKIDYWYEHQGGKYIINPLLKAGAIILLFVSLPYAGVAILAVKALLLKKIVDLPISIYNNMRAYEESQNGNKEIAEYYSSIDTCAKEIGANTNNKITIALTKGIDFTEFTLEMVLMVQGLFQLGDCIIQKISQKIGNANIAEEVRNSYNVVDDFGDDVVGKGGNKTKLDYVTSNGLVIEATPGKTTTVLGTYRSDTGAILDELGNVKSLDFGPKDGSFNLLNTPDELYVSPNQFWNEYNQPWLSNAVERNDIFKIATEPTWDNLTRTNMYTGKIELTGFGREYTYLRKHGYSFDNVTKTMFRKR
ncbi:hypothetical protein [Anaerosporobacter faecicola]|uniref:hypothetical protein n=1 Tax=Anaerosporobacter faecicola TaxID=2718714 RepID=UPI001A9B58DF|nr:hypothetical protein [Anaerosporobacter faecicola]